MGLKMSIDLLTTSARDYAHCQGKELLDYTMRGFSETEQFQFLAERKLRKSAEGFDCEVVVDLRYSVDSGKSETFFEVGSKSKHTVAGTGLIPKRK